MDFLQSDFRNTDITCYTWTQLESEDVLFHQNRFLFLKGNQLEIKSLILVRSTVTVATFEKRIILAY